MFHKAQQRYCLESLTKTHLVSQDAVDAVLVETNHPVETTHLKVTESS